MSCLLSNWFSFHHLHNRSAKTHSSHTTQAEAEEYRKHFEWKQILGISCVKQFKVKYHHYQCCFQKFTLFEYYRMGFFISFSHTAPLPSTTCNNNNNTTLIKFDYFSTKNNKNVLPKPITSVAIWLFECTVNVHRLYYHSIAMLKRHHFIVIRCGVMFGRMYFLSGKAYTLPNEIANERTRKCENFTAYLLAN